VVNDKTKALLIELGHRIKQARINKNITQIELADIVGKSRTAIEGAEKGKCTLKTFVSLLVALDLTDNLALFLPEQPISPVMLAKSQGKQRKRASSRKGKQTQTMPENDIGW